MHSKGLPGFVLLLCVQAFAVRELTGSTSRSLSQVTSTTASATAIVSDSTGTGGSATVSSTALSDGPGNVAVEARAQASAFSIDEARDQFAVTIAAAISEIESGGDALALARAAAQQYANAIAEAFTEATSVQVSSTGDGGSACSQATIPPLNAAQESALALVTVLAAASDRISFEYPSVAVEAIAAVTVDAFVLDQVQLCVSGAIQISSPPSGLSAAIEVPYREVTALALALSTPSTVVEPIRVTVVDGNLVVTTIDGRTANDVLDIFDLPQAIIIDIDG